MDKNKYLGRQRQRRRYRVRKRVIGTPDRPRLSVQRTLKHFSCQLINDAEGRTLASASTRDKDLKDSVGHGGNCEAAAMVGKAIAEKAKSLGVEQVRLDRGHARYHGRLVSFADAAREAGLQF